jgi:hypothetical protein
MSSGLDKISSELLKLYLELTKNLDHQPTEDFGLLGLSFDEVSDFINMHIKQTVQMSVTEYKEIEKDGYSDTYEGKCQDKYLEFDKIVFEYINKVMTNIVNGVFNSTELVQTEGN